MPLLCSPSPASPFHIHFFHLSVSEVCDALVLVLVTLNLIPSWSNLSFYSAVLTCMSLLGVRVVAVLHDVLCAPSIDLHVP